MAGSSRPVGETDTDAAARIVRLLLARPGEQPVAAHRVAALLDEYDRLRAQVAALTGEHSGTCDDMALCGRCYERDEIEQLRAMEQRAREMHTDGTASHASAAEYILGAS